MPKLPADRHSPHLRPFVTPLCDLIDFLRIDPHTNARFYFSLIQERCGHDNVVDSAPTRGTRRHCRRDRGIRHVGASGDSLGADHCRRRDHLSLVAGTKHRSRLGVDHTGARHRKYDLADRNHDPDADGRQSADRGTDGNDSERRALRTLHIGILDHLRLRTVQATTRTERPADTTPWDRAGRGTEQKEAATALIRVRP